MGTLVVQLMVLSLHSLTCGGWTMLASTTFRMVQPLSVTVHTVIVLKLTLEPERHDSQTSTSMIKQLMLESDGGSLTKESSMTWMALCWRGDLTLMSVPTGLTMTGPSAKSICKDMTE